MNKRVVQASSLGAEEVGRSEKTIHHILSLLSFFCLVEGQHRHCVEVKEGLHAIDFVLDEVADGLCLLFGQERETENLVVGTLNKCIDMGVIKVY